MLAGGGLRRPSLTGRRVGNNACLVSGFISSAVKDELSGARRRIRGQGGVGQPPASERDFPSEA